MTDQTPVAEAGPRAAAPRAADRPVGAAPGDPVVLAGAAGPAASSRSLLAFLVKTFLVQAFYIPSGSMENTLQSATGCW